MGEDCLVLGRLMYTLGIVMYAAANIPVSLEKDRVFWFWFWFAALRTSQQLWSCRDGQFT